MTARLEAADTRVATVARQASWSERNQRWLVAAISRLRERITTQAVRPPSASTLEDACLAAEGQEHGTPALLHCAELFGLTAFERELLLLVAGLELDQGLRTAVGAVNKDGVSTATFSLALGVLTQPHWDALSPAAPLRYWHLLALDAAGPPMRAPLRIDERILHFITGVPADDARLAGVVHRVEVPDEDEAGHDRELAGRVARSLTGNDARGPILVVHAESLDSAGPRHLAFAAIRRVARAALWIVASDLPAEGGDLVTLARRVDREAALADAVPVVTLDPGCSEATAASFAGHLSGPLLWLGAPSGALRALPHERRILRFDVPPPDPERTRLALLNRWRRAAASTPAACDDGSGVFPALEAAAAQFHLGPAAMDDIIERLETVPSSRRALAVWSAAREAARGGLEALAHRVRSNARVADLILPNAQRAVLHDITRQLRNRERVYREWGFGEKHPRGQGLAALFAGESGTGKTMAAEAIANEVELDLYRIDLATVVSKYIGETEKNLKRVFDAAEASGAVLLFDEADALFGKRSEIKDSHDRYANIEIAYLLQRVEAYRGLAILTTNMKSALDRAFMRRIRFIVQFPFPDVAAREQIWRREFPAATPRGDIDFPALARLNLSGGSIHGIVLNAAFKAADGPGRVDHALLADAARAEFAKLERSFSEPVAGGAA